MYQNERELEIQKLLSSESYMTVKQLSALLYTSESSIRRDLAALEQRGIVKRSYGGVELAKTNTQVPSFSSRVHYNIPEKKIMAQKAAQLVHDGDILFLDQSSSALFVARAIMQTARVTVVTNNTEIISLLAQSEIDVIASGGKLSKTNRNCLLGDDAQRIFTQIRANLLFFSSKALSPDGVIYDCDRDEVCIRNAMLANAEKKVFLCASEKYGQYSGYRQCTMDDVDYMISEINTPERYETLHTYRDRLL